MWRENVVSTTITSRARADYQKYGFNPIQGGSEQILFRGGAILHTPANVWTTGDTELKFYMVIDIHKLSPKIK